MGRAVKADTRLAELRAEEPDLGAGGALCLACYRDLESTRQVVAIPLGMSGSITTSGAVPWTAVADWCARRPLGRRETDIVAAVVRRLDVDHAKREHARVQQAAQAKP